METKKVRPVFVKATTTEIVRCEPDGRPGSLGEWMVGRLQATGSVTFETLGRELHVDEGKTRTVGLD